MAFWSRKRPEVAEAERAIARNDVARLRLLPIELSLQDPDDVWVSRICQELANHPDSTVRGNAILAFGHLARRFGRLEESVREALECALMESDPHVVSQARSAASDVRQLLGWNLGVGTPIDRVVWSGDAVGRRWRARQVDWLAPGDEVGETWTLVIETTDGKPHEHLRSWWSPTDRILGGRLAGWSKSAIGNLKRALAQTPPPPNGKGTRAD